MTDKIQAGLEGTACPVCDIGTCQLDGTTCRYVVEGVEVLLKRYVCDNPDCGYDTLIEEPVK